MKKLLFIGFLLIGSMSLVHCTNGGGEERCCTNAKDENKDCKCDICGTECGPQPPEGF